ncbi:glycosyltransferase [candidate division WOR-3 bacterium]|nr:glycosyltransferase [candidate division WOR-3 bacterium]
MQISVIMPVYNAASFVAQAVESTLQQPETGEVLLVEDGSSDNSLEVCRQLADEYPKVRLLRHADGKNHGAGASRNLGMQSARFDWIAFLDADDFFLPGRFSVAQDLLRRDPAAEGVYEAAGYHVDSEAGLARWTKAGKPLERLITMSRPVRPEVLWDTLMTDGGYFHLDALVLKKSVLARSGYMAEGLRLHQDTDFIMRVAMTARLLPGGLDEPVVMVRVHDHNRITAPRSARKKYDDRMRFWMTLYNWCGVKHQRPNQIRIMDWVIRETIDTRRAGRILRRAVPERALRLAQLLRLSLRYPRVALEPRFRQSAQAQVLPTRRGVVRRQSS